MKLLIEEASSDPSTALGAELAGWAYKASMPELLTIVAQAGKGATKVMPWVMKHPRTDAPASADEIAIADAELERDFVFV